MQDFIWIDISYKHESLIMYLFSKLPWVYWIPAYDTYSRPIPWFPVNINVQFYLFNASNNAFKQVTSKLSFNSIFIPERVV